MDNNVLTPWEEERLLTLKNKLPEELTPKEAEELATLLIKEGKYFVSHSEL